jgi:hypothetical protein
LALKARPTHPVDVNGNPLVLNQAQARVLAKLQATWDEHDDKAFSAIKDPKTKKLTETEDFEHALPLLNRLEERYLSDADRQKGVAWSQFFNFTARASEAGMDLVTHFDDIVRQFHNLGEPVTPAQLYHRFLEASLQSKGAHHQLLDTAIHTNPTPLTYDQMKVRFEKSALQTLPGTVEAAAPPARNAAAVNYVARPHPLALTPISARLTDTPKENSRCALRAVTAAGYVEWQDTLPRGATFGHRWTN